MLFANWTVILVFQPLQYAFLMVYVFAIQQNHFLASIDVGTANWTTILNLFILFAIDIFSSLQFL